MLSQCASLNMIVTIRIEHQGKKSWDDLGLQEKITSEQITQCKFDLLCHTYNNLKRIIDQALVEQQKHA